MTNKKQLIIRTCIGLSALTATFGFLGVYYFKNDHTKKVIVLVSLCLFVVGFIALNISLIIKNIWKLKENTENEFLTDDENDSK